MPKQTPTKRVLFVRRSRPVVLALFGVFSILTANVHAPKTAYADAANTVNFQARLQTASGAIVPDGNYNVEFTLYSGASCDPTTGSGCTQEWYEDYLNSASKGLQTVNGYLSANLGSVRAFPSTVQWDQKLWLSMNVGGTATIGTFPGIGDGEMLPYLSLTSVPAAFSASQLATSNVNGRSTLTLQGSGSGGGDQNFVIQDQGAAGTYDLLTQNEADANYIQNSSTTGAGSFNISGDGVADTLQGSTAVKTPSIRAMTDSTSALQVQNAAGTVSVLTVDTTNDRIGIGTTTPTATLDVMGSTSDLTSIALSVENSIGGSIITARNDGQVNIGTTAASGTSTTFGSMANTTADTGGGDSNYFIATKFTTGSNAGSLTSISAYVNAIDPNPSNDKYRLAIYADNGTNQPTTLIAESAEGTLVGNTFNTLPVTASLSGNTTYWLTYETNGTALQYNDFSYASGGTDQYYSYSNPYGTFPGTAASGGTNGALAQAIYGTYTEAGTATAPALTVTSAGNVGIGTATPTSALQVQGTVTATNLSLSGTGIGTAFQATSFDTVNAGTLSLGATNATSVSIGNGSATSTVTISNSTTGGAFVNNGSTLYSAKALSDFTSNGALGTAAATVDTRTSFTIPQTTSSISLTIPSPTDTTAGRVIYIANTGSASISIASVTLGAGSSASYFWNGTSWISTAVSTGVSLIGSLDSGTANSTGATISGNTLYLQSASSMNPGLVNNTTQTFSGDKTFTGTLQIQNSGGASLLSVNTSSNAINIGATDSTAAASTVNIANSSSSSSVQVVSIGSNGDTSNTLTLDAGTGASAIQIGNSNANHGIKIGTGTGVQTVTIGSGSSSSGTTIQGGTAGLVLQTGAAASGNSGAILIQSGNASSGAAGNVSIDVGSGSVVSGSSLYTDTFESGVSNWETWFSTSAVSTSTAQAHGATHSLTFTTTGAWGITRDVNYPGSAVTPGTSYTFTAWVRSSTSEKITLSASWVGSGTAKVTFPTVAANTWTKLTGSLVAPAGATNVYPTIQGNDTGGQTVYVDDVTVSTASSSPILSLGSANAAAVLLGNLNEAGATTIQGGSSGIFLASTSTTALAAQDGSGNSYFNVDTTGTGTITIGNVASNNYITFTASGGLVATGTAQHVKTISLTAEYAGAVLDVVNDGTCTSNNNGTMTSAYDGITNYYKWASNATAQCYDVVVRIPIPQDWASWASTSPIAINTYTTNTSTGLINLQVLKSSDNTAEAGCSYASVTPSSTSAWSTANSSNCVLASTTAGYAAGGTMTLRIRMTGNASSDVRIDGITISYKSLF